MYKHYNNYFQKSKFKLYTRSKLYSKLINNTDASVLEFGIGHGYFHDFCKRLDINYTGVDYSESILQFNKNGNELIKANIPDEFDKVNGTYDVIFAEHFIEHLRNYDEVYTFLVECKNRLSINGKIILLYPNFDHIGNIFYHDPTHSYVTNIYRIEKLLMDAGMNRVKSANYLMYLTGKQASILSVFSKLPLPLKIKLNTLLHSYSIATKNPA